jgi:transcriptional regulator with XRE-family HTH domain
MTETRRNPLRTNGYSWGPERVRLGLSLRQLEERSGVNRATLSLVEAGRLVPTGADYDAVRAALAQVEKERAS